MEFSIKGLMRRGSNSILKKQHAFKIHFMPFYILDKLFFICRGMSDQALSQAAPMATLTTATATCHPCYHQHPSLTTHPLLPPTTATQNCHPLLPHLPLRQMMAQVGCSCGWQWEKTSIFQLKSPKTSCLFIVFY